MKIELQGLTDHTVHRIIQIQREVLPTIAHRLPNGRLIIYFKWGCDGSGGHSI